MEQLSELDTKINNRNHSLELAARLASLDPCDVMAFRLFLAIFWIVNQETILKIRTVTSPYLAIHMTCRPRMDRANESVDSFSAIPGSILSHIKLIGNERTYAFDSENLILEVPSGDHYEDLPAKIFLGFLIIVLACNPQCIVKLDDDHRLGDGRQLIRLLHAAGGSRGPVQYGNHYNSPQPAGHSRGWHFGKCSSEELSSNPVEMPMPHSFALGGYGYVANRQALWRLAPSALFYRKWLSSIIYEDVAVSEVADKTWIRKIDCYQIETAIACVDDYMFKD